MADKSNFVRDGSLRMLMADKSNFVSDVSLATVATSTTVLPPRHKPGILQRERSLSIVNVANSGSALASQLPVQERVKRPFALGLNGNLYEQLTATAELHC